MQVLCIFPDYVLLYTLQDSDTRLQLVKCMINDNNFPERVARECAAGAGVGFDQIQVGINMVCWLSGGLTTSWRAGVRGRAGGEEAAR